MKPPLRTKLVGTKVSEAEFALLEERARGAGMRLGEWVREALLSAPAESQQPGAGGSFASSDTSGSLSTGSESLAYRYSVLQNGWSSGYSPNGNVVGYTDSVMGNWSFGYDSGSRLTSATASPAVEGSTSYLWSYDSFGNRLTQTGNGGSNVWAQYANDSGGNPHNQVTQTNARGVTWTPSYDAAGNMLTDGANQYLYDADGHVCAVSSGGTMTGYIYNPAGQRVAKGTITSWSCNTSSNGFVATKQYLIGPGGEQMTEFAVDSSGNQTWVHTNVNVAGMLATYINDGTGPHFRFTDQVGTMRAQTTYAGTLEQTCQSLPFGDGPGCTSATEQFYTGYERDSESGNDYAQARHYASSLGRFLSPDPSGLMYASAANPQSFNLYGYVLNNPLGNIDPSGLVCTTLTNADGTTTEGDSSDGQDGQGCAAGNIAPDGTDMNQMQVNVNGDGPDWDSFNTAWGMMGSGSGLVSNGDGYSGPAALGPAPNNGRNCSAGPASAGQYVAATAEVATLTSQWASGLGPGDRTFGPGTATSAVMGQSAGVTEVLGAYMFTGQTSGLYTFGASGAYVAGGNPVAQFVGSFRWSISGNMLTLTNTTSLRSLTYDHGPQYQRGGFPTPGGNTHQTYQIQLNCHG